MSTKTTTALSEEQVRANGPLSVHTRRLVHLLGISGNACHLLRVLLDHANSSWEDCFPGKGALATEARCSLSTVKKSLAELAVAGIITVTQRPKDGRRWDSNTYAIQPAAFASASQNANAPRSPRALPPRSPHDLPGASHDLPLGRRETPNGAKGMQPVMKPVIMQPPRERAEENHDENLRPSSDESAANPGVAGSDDLAPSRAQMAPSVEDKARLEASKVKPICTKCGTNRWCELVLPALAESYVCPACRIEARKDRQRQERLQKAW